MSASQAQDGPTSLSEVFKAVAAKAHDIKAAVIPFEVKKEHLTLTIDSNLVYYAAEHEY